MDELIKEVALKRGGTIYVDKKDDALRIGIRCDVIKMPFGGYRFIPCDMVSNDLLPLLVDEVCGLLMEDIRKAESE